MKTHSSLIPGALERSFSDPWAAQAGCEQLAKKKHLVISLNLISGSLNLSQSRRGWDKAKYESKEACEQ
jgi:hypothetical protein